MTGPIIEYRWSEDTNLDPIPLSAPWRPDGNSDVQPGSCYRFFAANDELLYIGFTVNPVRRFRDHAQTPLWREAVRVEVVWYPDQVDARIAESRVLEKGPLKYCNQKAWMRYRSDYVSPITRDEARANHAALVARMAAKRNNLASSTVDLGAGDGFRWTLWLYPDGTAQVAQQLPDRLFAVVVGRRPAADVRAALAEMGISDEAWPA